MSEMRGRRIANWFEDGVRQKGEYGIVQCLPEGGYVVESLRSEHSELWFVDPFGRAGRIDGTRHKIIEEDDGSITVQPSIAPLPDEPAGRFHGFLTRGTWTW